MSYGKTYSSVRILSKPLPSPLRHGGESNPYLSSERDNEQARGRGLYPSGSEGAEAPVTSPVTQAPSDPSGSSATRREARVPQLTDHLSRENTQREI